MHAYIHEWNANARVVCTGDLRFHKLRQKRLTGQRLCTGWWNSPIHPLKLKSDWQRTLETRRRDDKRRKQRGGIFVSVKDQFAFGCTRSRGKSSEASLDKKRTLFVLRLSTYFRRTARPPPFVSPSEIPTPI